MKGHSASEYVQRSGFFFSSARTELQVRPHKFTPAFPSNFLCFSSLIWGGRRAFRCHPLTLGGAGTWGRGSDCSTWRGWCGGRRRIVQLPLCKGMRLAVRPSRWGTLGKWNLFLFQQNEVDVFNCKRVLLEHRICFSDDTILVSHQDAIKWVL